MIRRLAIRILNAVEQWRGCVAAQATIDDLNQATAHLSDADVPAFLRRHAPVRPLDAEALRHEFAAALKRIDSLERQLGEADDRLLTLDVRRIELRDLPLGSLMRKLEQDWHPQASILLGERCITAAMLAD